MSVNTFVSGCAGNIVVGDSAVLNVGASPTDGEKMKFLTFKMFQLWLNISLPVSLSEYLILFCTTICPLVRRLIDFCIAAQIMFVNTRLQG